MSETRKNTRRKVGAKNTPQDCESLHAADMEKTAVFSASAFDIAKAVVKFSPDLDVADANIFDKASTFLRNLAVKIENLKLGWLVRWLAPDLPKVLKEVVELLNALANALDNYGE